MKQRYDSYKSSGIDWIGDIPSHWNILPLKRISVMFGRIGYRGYTVQDLTEDGNGAITLSPSNMVDGRMDYSNVSYLSWYKYHESPEIKIQQGDILYVKTGSTFGKTSYVDELPMEATINPQILRIVPSIHPKYLAYCMSTPYSQALTDCYVVGSTIPTISQESIGNFSFAIPPLAEQEAIAAWLDEKCGEIDSAIAKVDREIELIDELKQSEISRVVTRGLNPDAPLRHSGIDWIGDVPKHWIVAPFKRSLRINNGCDYKHIVSEEGYPVIGSGGQFAFASDYLYDGEVLLLGRKGTIDRPMYFIGKFWTVDTMFYAIPNDNVCCKYMYYQALGFPYDYYSTATALPSMAASDLANNPIIVPPLSEQQAIADYLDKKCAEIDGLKVKLVKKRDTLKELRQAIISEVVTGKRKVI